VILLEHGGQSTKTSPPLLSINSPVLAMTSAESPVVSPEGTSVYRLGSRGLNWMPGGAQPELQFQLAFCWSTGGMHGRGAKEWQSHMFIVPVPAPPGFVYLLSSNAFCNPPQILDKRLSSDLQFLPFFLPSSQSSNSPIPKTSPLKTEETNILLLQAPKTYSNHPNHPNHHAFLNPSLRPLRCGGSCSKLRCACHLTNKRWPNSSNRLSSIRTSPFSPSKLLELTTLRPMASHHTSP
jgi:hypothetical protein